MASRRHVRSGGGARDPRDSRARAGACWFGPARRTEGRPSGRRRCHRGTWSSSPACQSRKASSIRARPRARPTPPETPPGASTPASGSPRLDTRTGQPRLAPHPAGCPARRRFPQVRELRSRLQRRPRCSSATSTASTSTTSRTPTKPQLLASVVCPGGQGDVSVYGNLLFMSVEQTRGRLDCGTQGVTDDGQHRALPRRPHLRHQRHQASRSRSRRCRPAAARTRTRWSPIRRTRRTSTSTARARARVRSGRGARRLLGRGAEGRSEHGALQHRRDPGAARRAAEGAHRQPAAHLRRSSRPATSPACGTGGDHGPGTQTTSVTNQCHDITVFPEVGLAAGACSGNGILLDISDPVHPVRLDSRRRQELRLLALGDVQQRRHEGDLHRRVGRRHAAALPRDRSAQLGRRRHLRHRRPQAAVRGLLQDAGAADRAGELRRAQRLAHPGARPRHHGAGVVSGRRLGVRLHRLGAPGRDRVLRSRSDRREAR